MVNRIRFWIASVLVAFAGSSVVCAADTRYVSSQQANVYRAASIDSSRSPVRVRASGSVNNPQGNKRYESWPRSAACTAAPCPAAWPPPAPAASGSPGRSPGAAGTPGFPPPVGGHAQSARTRTGHAHNVYIPILRVDMIRTR